MSVCLLTTTSDTDEGGCVQLTTDAWHTRWKRMCTSAGDPFNESWRAAPAFEPAFLLPSSPSPSCTVHLSPWLQLDAHNAGVRHDTEIAHCTFLNLTCTILPVPHLAHTLSYATLSSIPLVHLAVRVSIYFLTSSFPAGACRLHTLVQVRMPIRQLSDEQVGVYAS
ncbi:hypothetical protein EDD18DRAFT_1472478 [Armillaria luteobubalina]|uniref:Uncharacterized protein n=1 Tax=Armillaria luteobubalina TaxID=153913 RepID=A0AA39NVA9_9AGAR|nr:hypothetical protein EDD18DRAFT_1472478 [Armillaria luteobubalina]